MFNQLLKVFVTQQAKRVKLSSLHPELAQERTFRKLRKVLKHSELALSTGFTDCYSLDDVRHLPATDSTRLKPQLQRVKTLGNDARHVFGDSRLKAFARTSGTTGDNKDIPINQAYLKALDRSLVRAIACHLYCTQGWKDFFKGRHVILASRPYIEDSPTGLPIVDITGLNLTRTPKGLRWLYIPRFKDLWLQEWTKRLHHTVEQSSSQNVTTITGIPVMMKAFVSKVRAEHDGAFLDELWPNLRYYIYGAVPISAREKSELRKQWFSTGDKYDFYFVETYFATEAFLAHSFHPDQEGLVLNLLEYLFLFKEQSSDPQSLLAHELEPSKNYLLYVTTPGGLINYAMGDRIKVISKNPLLIQMVGREHEEVSLTGEKITLEQLRLTVHDLPVDNTAFMVWPETQGDHAHLNWAFPDTFRTVLQTAAHNLDASLSQYNTLYNEALNVEQLIAPSRVHFIPARVIANYEQKMLGVGQFKPQQIFQSREALEQAIDWKLASEYNA